MNIDVNDREMTEAEEMLKESVEQCQILYITYYYSCATNNE